MAKGVNELERFKRRFLILALLPALMAGSPLEAMAHGTPSAAPSASAPNASPSPARPAAPQRPVTDQTITAEDVVNTPLTDLNVHKRPIPQVLTKAVEQPYVLTGMSSCAQLAKAVTELNEVLGDDLDVQKARGAGLSPGGVAKSVVGSFIPFEGAIQEVSGAAPAQRRMQLAIHAGAVRRAFLKGIGEQRGCSYPARPATAAMALAKSHTSTTAKLRSGRFATQDGRRDLPERSTASGR
jgi:hypothetical protein